MKTLRIIFAIIVISILFMLVFSCTDISEEVEPIQKDNIEIYKYKDFVISIDYSKPLEGKGPIVFLAPAFTLLESPDGGEFHTNVDPYGPDMFFDSPDHPWEVFSLRGIYIKMDSLHGRFNKNNWLVRQ